MPVVAFSKLVRVWPLTHLKVIVDIELPRWAINLVLVVVEIILLVWCGVCEPVSVLVFGIVDASIVVHILR